MKLLPFHCLWWKNLWDHTLCFCHQQSMGKAAGIYYFGMFLCVIWSQSAFFNEGIFSVKNDKYAVHSCCMREDEGYCHYKFHRLTAWVNTKLRWRTCVLFTSRYEGTGRSLSLKLIQQLREQSITRGPSNKGNSSTPLGRSLHEITLNESIRYAPGDEVERWLNHLLCLDATVVQRLSSGCPLPENCDLYPLQW